MRPFLQITRRRVTAGALSLRFKASIPPPAQFLYFGSSRGSALPHTRRVRAHPQRRRAALWRRRRRARLAQAPLQVCKALKKLPRAVALPRHVAPQRRLQHRQPVGVVLGALGAKATALRNVDDVLGEVKVAWVAVELEKGQQVLAEVYRTPCWRLLRKATRCLWLEVRWGGFGARRRALADVAMTCA